MYLDTSNERECIQEAGSETGPWRGNEWEIIRDRSCWLSGAEEYDQQNSCLWGPPKLPQLLPSLPTRNRIQMQATQRCCPDLGSSPLRIYLSTLSSTRFPALQALLCTSYNHIDAQASTRNPLTLISLEKILWNVFGSTYGINYNINPRKNKEKHLKRMKK